MGGPVVISLRGSIQQTTGEAEQKPGGLCLKSGTKAGKQGGPGGLRLRLIPGDRPMNRRPPRDGALDLWEGKG